MKRYERALLGLTAGATVMLTIRLVQLTRALARRAAGSATAPSNGRWWADVPPAQRVVP